MAMDKKVIQAEVDHLVAKLPDVDRTMIAPANIKHRSDISDYHRRLLDNLGFVLLFGKVSDAELVKIALSVKDQINATSTFSAPEGR